MSHQYIEPQDGDFAEEPIRNSDSSNSISRRSQLLPFEFADVRGRQNRFDFLRCLSRMVDGSSNDSDALEATDVVVSLVRIGDVRNFGYHEPLETSEYI
jgi:hypothetical protein